MDSWPDVRTIAVDLAHQSVAMELGPGAPPIRDLLDALRGLDIEVQEERTLGDGGPILTQAEEGSDAERD